MNELAAKPVVTVGALIERSDGKVLLVRTHKWRDQLGVPGGKIEYGESQEAALIREIREETGLIARDVRFLLVQEAVDSAEFYKPAHLILLNYTCRVDDTSKLLLNDEAEGFLWVAPSEALRLDLSSFTRTLVKAFLALAPAS